MILAAEFLAFELFFCVVLLVFREETRSLFPLSSVLIANTLAAIAIGYYLWRHHPDLRESMRQTPLGAAPVYVTTAQTPSQTAAALRAGHIEGLTALAARTTTTLRPVLNATGVVVHTNLGRAPLAFHQREAATNLELDLATGQRGSRSRRRRRKLS